MIKLNDSFTVDATLYGLKGANVAHVYEGLTRQAAIGTGLRDAYIRARLEEQERRATSGIGGGIAIPHLRLKKLTRPYTLLARLAKPVDFNAVDRKPVDLVFMLLSPEHEIALHLQRLSRFSRLLRDPALCSALREVSGADGLAALMLQERSLARAA